MQVMCMLLQYFIRCVGAKNGRGHSYDKTSSAYLQRELHFKALARLAKSFTN